MAIQILTDEQRRRYARFAGNPSPEQLARHFHLDIADQEIIQTLRGDHNRLGFALMLCSARFLGAFPDNETEVPKSVRATLARQIALEPDAPLSGHFGSRQRDRHLAAIQESYGFSDFLAEGYARFRLARWLYALCWSGDDHPGPLIERAISWLIANKVLLPGVTTLERFVGRIRDRARNRLWRRLVLGLNQDQRMRIAGLFDEAETSRFSELDALRTAPTKRRPTEFLAHLDRLDAIRAFNLRPVSPKGVPAATLERLARVARVGKPSAIAALQEPRRTATVAALFYTLEANAQDDAAELAEALLTDLIKDAEVADKTARLRSLRDLDAAALLLRDMGRLVFDEAALPLDQWREALFERLPRADLEAAMAEIDAIARPNDVRPYQELLRRWRRTRKLFFNIVTRIETGFSPSGEKLDEAIRYLKGVANWSNAAMRDAPTQAVPKSWRAHVLDEDGRVGNPKAYVFAIIDAWRMALKRRDVFAKPGIRYGDPRRGLLDGATWQESKLMVCRALNRSLDAKTEIDAVVPGTLRDSLVILALLLEQETELDPQEIMTDTAAYSDAIFGLFWLLGYQFSPRLADIGGVKLWRIDRAADYGPFQDIAKSTVNLNLIRDNWSDLIRLAGSLKLGHLKAAGIMRTLQIKDRPTTLARALSELGRIVKTIHILRYAG